MSRILRRPMFRGGRVDSRGTGIASGLGYNNGGRVSYTNGGVSTTGGFKRSPISKGFGWLSDYVLSPWANQFNKNFVNPWTGLFGYGDFPPTAATRYNTPEEEWAVMRGGKQPPVITDSGAIPKAIKEQDNAILLENLEAEKNKDKSLEEIMKEMMGSKKTKEERKAEIKENEEMFKEVYGSGRADDASAMLLNFAGKALKPEATVKSAFGEFFEEEGKRPSEHKKYKDAAKTAAINAYLTGEKDYDSMMKQMKIIDYQIDAKSDAAKAVKEGLSFAEIKAGLPGTMKDREKTKTAAELFVQYTDKGKTFTVIDEDEDTDELLKAPQNEGQYFMNRDTKEVFKILKGIKQFIYSG